jgi:ribosomal protein S18 acetylase RimI-like enzyme
MEFKIRPYHPGDLSRLYDICVQTGDCGRDITDEYPDPDLFGHFFAAPYAVLEPDLCFVLTGDGVPCGYVLGTRDSEEFSWRMDQEWLPVLRERYPLPPAEEVSAAANMTRFIHAGYHSSPEMAGYPAHLHIDLLPLAQGQGNGRRLMECFLCRLREVNVHAVHLAVGGENERAIAFYERMGFEILGEQPWGYFMGLVLDR